MVQTETIEDGLYKSRLQCPACGYSTDAESDVDEVIEVYRKIENGPKGRLVVYLKNIKELRQLKEYIPELAIVPNSELAKIVKEAGMKWVSEEDYLMIIETIAGSADIYGLKAEVIKS